MQCGQTLGRGAVLPVDDQRGKANGGVGGAHEVSIRITARGVVGQWRGWQPVSKVSMMIMRPPQHGQGCARGCGGSVSLVASAAGGARFKSVRTSSMVSVRLLLAAGRSGGCGGNPWGGRG